MKLQITLFDPNNHYRPISTIITVDSMEDFDKNRTQHVKKAITNMATKRYKTPKELYAEGYTTYKFRPYQDEDKKSAFVEKIMKNLNKKA